MSPFKIAMALAAVGFLTWTHLQAVRYGADGVRLETAQAALKQVERAQEATTLWQDKTTDAQTLYTKAQNENTIRDRHIRSLNDRMRNQAPSAVQLAQLTPAALGDYAAEVERDFAECRAAVADLGATAASASAAAWALNDAWPD